MIYNSLYEKVLSQEITQNKVNFSFSGKFDEKVNGDTLKIKSPSGAAIRSLIIPGLGQIYNDKKLKAFFAASCEGILLYSIYDKNNKFNDTGNTKYRETRNTLEWWLFLMLGISAVDAYVDAYLDKFNEKMSISLAYLNKKSINVNLSIKF